MTWMAPSSLTRKRKERERRLFCHFALLRHFVVFLFRRFFFISFCRFLESKSILNHILFIDTKIAVLSFCQIRFCRFVESISSFPFYFVLSFSRIEVYIKSYFIHRYENCYFVFLSNSVLSFSFQRLKY